MNLFSWLDLGREKTDRERGWAVGKPYAEEMHRLPETYDWAMGEPISLLIRSLRGLGGLPLMAVGSGGALTAAHFACDLHRHHTGNPAEALTPLRALASPIDLRAVGVLIPSAGGKNPDVLGAFRGLVAREPRKLVLLCAAMGAPLARAGRRLDFVECCEYAPPSGKDGFLAINSLLAFSVLLARAYAAASGLPAELPADWGQLHGCGEDWLPEALDAKAASVWQRETVVVLHGPATQTAALDLESKCTEAALTGVQVADYRHFAHGRHHWLAKHGDRSSILALRCQDDEATAERTLSLLPVAIPVLRVPVPHSGLIASLASLVRVFHLVGSLGRARAIDPGDPGVPSFGRRLYRLNVYGRDFGTGDAESTDQIAVERKSGSPWQTLRMQGTLETWREALGDFRTRLREAQFGGVVLDYDGTLCREAERREPLPEAAAKQLTRLLRLGAIIGVATGRGKSVRRALRDTIPSRWWSNIFVGYYNGAEVGTLEDESIPDNSPRCLGELAPAEALVRESQSRLDIKADFRPRQITLEPAEGAAPWGLWDRVRQLLLRLPASAVSTVSVLRSGHSVDVVAPGVSKIAVVDAVRQRIGPDGDILCIGDRGRWPGNDHALLATPHSLSVDEVSADPATCWNLAPAGHRGLQATLGYLGLLKRKGGAIRLNLPGSEAT